MPTTPEARARLAALMEERRLELGLRWQDVVDAAIAAGFKLSLKALHSARAGTAGVRPLTQRAIEAGLQWEHGSFQRSLDGGGPVPLAAAPAVAEPEPESPADDADVTTNVVLAAINPIERQVLAEIHAHPGGTPAELIFADELERALWGRTLTPERQRIREIAAYRSVQVRPTRPAARRAG